MLSRRAHLNRRAVSPTVMLRSMLAGNWRALVALATAFAFVSILLTAATHHHASAVEDNACAVCSIAIHKIADTHLVALPNMVAVLIFYADFVLESRDVTHAISLYLPPSCGPPRTSSAIC
jgi:tetrahydromethanopterin S-methyltransferase subunit D